MAEDQSVQVLLEPIEIQLAPGTLMAVVGPSGSGKTTALSRVERQWRGACSVQRIRFPSGVSVLDRVAPWADLPEITAVLTSCGLSQPGIWLRSFFDLSDGERFRARLARAVALQSRSGTVTPLLCDEFCSTLHRRLAKSIAFNLRRVTTQQKLITIVACCNEDVLRDLSPDSILRLTGRGNGTLEYPSTAPRSRPTLRNRLVVEQGTKQDYSRFADMHYRKSDELGFVDKVFVVRDRPGGELLGIVVYCYPQLGLALRNQSTERRFVNAPKQLNRHMRILRRLVIHPDARGCGVGKTLVRRTLPLVGTEFVECLANLGAFNPVFEKAGMKRIGRYALPAGSQEALDALQRMGVDPRAHDFVVSVARRPKVRRVVHAIVHRWYAATTGGGESRVPHQTAETLAQTFRGIIGSRPVYYLWRRKRNKRKQRETRSNKSSRSPGRRARAA